MTEKTSWSSLRTNLLLRIELIRSPLSAAIFLTWTDGDEMEGCIRNTGGNGR
jgi:hypothetical protein